MPIGKVKGLEGNYALVTIERQDMCGECHACNVIGEVKSCEIKCVNACNSKVGDIVEIEQDESRFIKSIFIMYGIPLVAFFIGLGIGKGVTQALKLPYQDLWIALGAVGAIAVSLLGIKILEKKNKYKKMLPQIIKIIEE